VRVEREREREREREDMSLSTYKLICVGALSHVWIIYGVVEMKNLEFWRSFDLSHVNVHRSF